MQDFKKEFPVLHKYTYLNTAYSGLMHNSLIEWRRNHDLAYLNNGSLFRDNHHNTTEEIRKSAGSFFNCNEACVALVPNFSYAFNTVLAGLAPRRKVLLLKNDYPNVNEPFERGDFEIVYAEINENLEENIYQAITTSQPEIFAFSIVQYINGIKIDLDFLRKLKEDFPNLLIIADGTQFLGTAVFDFENSGIDIIGASAYKWLLAGYGNGFMLFKKEIVPLLFTQSFKKVAPTEFSKTQEHLMNHFEPGHLNSLSLGSLGHSLQFLITIGQENITAKLMKLSHIAKEKFTEHNLLETKVLLRKTHSTIFNIKGDKEVFNRLKAKNILCSLRGDGIRVSFHFYNSEKDIEGLLTCLKNS